MNIKELKKLYQDFMSMFEGQNETVRQVVFSEFVFFMIYFAGVDQKISAKEVKFIEDITGNEVTNMSDVYQQLKDVSFKERVPKTLTALIKTDKDYDADFENSMSLRYLRTLYEIGDALIKVDGVKDSERKESMEYFGGLIDYCKSQLGEETKPNVSKKKKEPARETTQSRSSNKGKRKKTAVFCTSGSSTQKNVGNMPCLSGSVLTPAIRTLRPTKLGSSFLFVPYLGAG